MANPCKTVLMGDCIIMEGFPTPKSGRKKKESDFIRSEFSRHRKTAVAIPSGLSLASASV